MVITEHAPRVDPVGRSRLTRSARPLFSVLVAAVAVWALVLFLTDHPAKSPVFAPVPVQPAHASVVHGICRSSDGLGDPNPHRDQVWVDAGPSGALALWLPAWNDRPCVSVLARLDATRAQALAAAVRAAKAPPSRGFSESAGPEAPADGEGASVTVFFTYPGKAKAEVARVFLGPYGGLTAPGRDTRILPDSGHVALRPAPPLWKKYVGARR